MLNSTTTISRFSLLALFILAAINNLPAQSSFSNHDFTEIDKHADNASPQLKNSIPALVKYLTRPAQSDLQKVRAVFRWITQNINYDVDAFFNERLRVEDPQRVINRGKAVCGGYAVLFKTMCEQAGIKSEVIAGWSKGYGEQITLQANHAWNSVIINNRPYLLDVTWGAGYLDEQTRFKKSFNEHYFLTDPQQFIYDHLPEDDYWQLRKNPISRSAFKGLILLRPAFFKTGLKLITHKNSTITVKDELIIKIQAPHNTFISAQLIKGGKALPDNFHLIQKQKGLFELGVHFPTTGNYILRIFSKFGNNPKESYAWACDYNVDVQKTINKNPFVVQYSAFDDLNGYLLQPVDLILENSKMQDFSMYLENALEVFIFQGGNMVPLNKSGNNFSGSVLLNTDTVRVIAKIDETNNFHYLLEYFGR